MTRKLTFLILALLALIAIPTWGQEQSVTMSYSGSTTGNMTGGNDAALVNLDDSHWSVIGDKGGNNNFPGLNKAGQIRLYGAANNHNVITVTNLDDATITTIKVTYGASNYNAKVTVGDIEVTGTGSDAEKTYSINSSSFSIAHNYNDNTQVYILSIEINYSTGTTPSITVNPSTITWDNSPINEELSETITVSQANLEENITITSTIGIVTPSTIAAGAEATDVTLTYTPTTTGDFDGTISFTSGEITKTVTVSGSAYDPSQVETFEKFTGNLEEGDYVIYYDGKAMKNTVSSNRLDYLEITPNNDAIINPDATIVWHIAQSGDYWTIYNENINKYAAGTTTRNQAALIDEITDYAKWTVTASNGTYEFVNLGRENGTSDPDNKYLRNNGSYGWACYSSSTGDALTLYKKVNASSVATPTISPEPTGTYFDAIDVTIACETSDASIRYTTDGSEPTSTSTLYDDTPIHVTATTTIKAIAILDEESSNVATATYTFGKTYASLAELVADGEPTTAGETVRVTLTNEVITNFYTSSTSGNRNGVYLMVGEQEIEIYCYDVPTDWVVGGKLSGTLTCPWKLYDNTTWELCPENWEELTYTEPQLYPINFHHQSGGTATTSPADEAAEGTEVTIIATPEEHYHVGTITVIDVNLNEIPVEDGKFTMPASSVYITVMFEGDPQYYITYYYNGGFHHHSEGMYVGPVGSLFNPEDMTPPAGFSFVGWSTSMASTDPIDENYIITDFTKLYAIFEKANTSRENGEDSFVKVTEAPEDWSGEYLLVYEVSDTEGLAWTGVDVGQCHTDVVISDNVIASQPTDAVTLALATMEGGYSIRVNGGTNDGKYIGKSSYANGLDLKENEQLNTLSMDEDGIIIAAEAEQDGVHCTMRYNNSSGTSNERFRYYKSGQEPVQLYKKQGTESVVNRRYTRVYDDTYPASGLEIIVEGPSIVVSGYILETNSVDNDNAANLIIEDGAQLKTWFETLATVQKNIKAYTDATGNDGYYLIANPTAIDANEEDEYDALDGCAQFDLYFFDPTKVDEWRNIGSTSQKVTFERNVGYLFASANNTTVNFRGYLLPAGETEITLVKATEGPGIDFPGFNLIGNPYTCNAYPTDEDGNFMPFYKMNKAGSELELEENVEAIAPCQGFFVEANANGDKVTISTTAPEAPASMMSLTVSQNRGNVIDRAIVSFDGANNLHKFMMNPAHTNISLAKNGEEFAAVSASSTSGELPVNFKAEKNGSYTITVNVENVDAEYLHLIDNKTGMDTDLLSTPSYTFDAKTSDYASRFKLVFSMTGIEENGSNASSFAYISNGNLVIDNIEGQATLQIIDGLGRVISTETVSGSYNKALNLKAGLYILNLNGMTQKIVVE